MSRSFFRSNNSPFTLHYLDFDNFKLRDKSRYLFITLKNYSFLFFYFKWFLKISSKNFANENFSFKIYEKSQIPNCITNLEVFGEIFSQIKNLHKFWALSDYCIALLMYIFQHFIFKINTLEQLKNVNNYNFLKDKMNDNKLKGYALWLDVSKSDVYLFSYKEKRFIKIDEESYEKLYSECQTL